MNAEQLKLQLLQLPADQHAAKLDEWHRAGISPEHLLETAGEFWPSCISRDVPLCAMFADAAEAMPHPAFALMNAAERAAHAKLPEVFSTPGPWSALGPIPSEADLGTLSASPQIPGLDTPRSWCFVKIAPTGQVWVWNYASLLPEDGLARRAQLFGPPMHDEDIDASLSRCRSAEDRCVAMISLLPLIPMRSWLKALETWWTEIADPTGHLQLVVAALASAMYEGHLAISEQAEDALDGMAQSINPETYFAAMSPEAGRLFERMRDCNPMH